MPQYVVLTARNPVSHEQCLERASKTAGHGLGTWSLRCIQQETGVGRETASVYLESRRSPGSASRPTQAASGKTGHFSDHRVWRGVEGSEWQSALLTASGTNPRNRFPKANAEQTTVNLRSFLRD
jgi:hypothetical protein